MSETLHRLSCLLTDLESLRRLNPKTIDLDAYDRIADLTNDIRISLIKGKLCDDETLAASLRYHKLLLINNVLAFCPEWVGWDRDESTITFLQVSALSKTLVVRCHVNVRLHRESSGRYFTLFCLSESEGIQLRLKVRPEELVQSVLGFLRCCGGSSVRLGRSAQLQPVVVVKEEADELPVEAAPMANMETNDSVHQNDLTMFQKASPKGHRKKNKLVKVGKTQKKRKKQVVLNGHMMEDVPSRDSNATEGELVQKASSVREEYDLGDEEFDNDPEDGVHSELDVKAEDGALGEKSGVIGSESGLIGAESEVIRLESGVRDSDSGVVNATSATKSNSGGLVLDTPLTLPCRLCGRIINAGNGSRHLLKKHGISNPECCFCDEAVDSEESLASHYARSHPIKRLRCKICKKKVVYHNGRRHLRKAHDIDRPECCFCPQKFKHNVELSKHNRLHHSTSGPIKEGHRRCKLCDALLTRKEEFDHMKMKHDRLYECPLCEFKSDDPNSEDIETLVRLGNKGIPPGEDRAEDVLKQHIRNFHMKKSRRCCLCNITFDSVELLAQHRPTCEKKGTIKWTKESLCSECGILITETEKPAHYAKVHGKTEFYRFSCKFCPKAYGQSFNLRRHLVQVHFPEKRMYRCEICAKAFSQKDGFIRHKQIHGQFTLKCLVESCNKVFKLKSGVIQHMKGCHYPPQFECLVCQKRFPHRGHIRVHIKQIHHIEDWEPNMSIHKVDFSELYAALKGVL